MTVMEIEPTKLDLSRRLSPKEAASLIGGSDDTVIRAIRRGEIRGQRVGGRYWTTLNALVRAYPGLFIDDEEAG